MEGEPKLESRTCSGDSRPASQIQYLRELPSSTLISFNKRCVSLWGGTESQSFPFGSTLVQRNLLGTQHGREMQGFFLVEAAALMVSNFREIFDYECPPPAHWKYLAGVPAPISEFTDHYDRHPNIEFFVEKNPRRLALLGIVIVHCWAQLELFGAPSI